MAAPTKLEWIPALHLAFSSTSRSSSNRSRSRFNFCSSVDVFKLHVFLFTLFFTHSNRLFDIVSIEQLEHALLIDRALF